MKCVMCTFTRAFLQFRTSIILNVILNKIKLFYFPIVRFNGKIEKGWNIIVLSMCANYTTYIRPSSNTEKINISLQIINMSEVMISVSPMKAK